MKSSTALLAFLLVPLVPVLALLLTPPLRAQAESLPNSQWAKPLAKIEELLTEGKHEEAEKRVGKLLGEMVTRIGFYEADPRFPARALLYLAVAETGLGQSDQARWHLYVARNLDRRLVTDDLERYGTVGVATARLPYRKPGKIPEDALAAEPKPPEGATYRPLSLEVITSNRMILPCNRVSYDRSHLPLPLDVELLVDPEGRPTQPRILSRVRFPIFAMVALEQLQDWRYRPAAKGEQPVHALDRQKVDFPCSSSL